MLKLAVTIAWGITLLNSGCLPEESAEEQIEGQRAQLEPGAVRGSYVQLTDEQELVRQELAEKKGGVLYAAGGPPTIIYMNRSGGTYTPGFPNNSAENISSAASTVGQILPWDVSDSDWQQVMTCTRSMFSRFNVTIVDQDPGNVPHIESVVAGLPADIGITNPNVGGVSPYSCSGDRIIENSIVYTFAERYDNMQTVCEVVAQEVAHSFGLDHLAVAADPMTYLNYSGNKTFQDQDSPCGEVSPRECLCGGTTENSVQMLLSKLGESTGEPVPPQEPGPEPGNPGSENPENPGTASDQVGGCNSNGAGSLAMALLIGLCCVTRRRVTSQ